MPNQPPGRLPGSHRVTDEERRAWHDQAAARAVEAMETAHRNLEAQKPEAARRWLERASRLAPGDPTITLSLASVMFTLGALPASERHFRDVARRFQSREAATGLAACLAARGADQEAASVIGAALSAHVPDQAMAALAGHIARQAGYQSWCAVDGGGTLLSGADPARLTITLDGAPARLRLAPAPARLPNAWREAATLHVSENGRGLLGSPVSLASIRRVEGVVASRDGGLVGWAWHPADPGRKVCLTITPAGGGKPVRVMADRDDLAVAGSVPLTRPSGFTVAAAEMPEGPIDVRDADGKPLLGSPLDPGAAALSRQSVADLIAGRKPPDAALSYLPLAVAPRPGRDPTMRVTKRGIAIVIPAYRGVAETGACLDAALATLPRGVKIIVVDDASPEPALAAALDRLVSRRRIELVRHATNRGFPRSANAGIRAADGRDVILLNSDTLVPTGWVERLRDAVYTTADIGTATPLSNDATILSYPSVETGNPVPDAASVSRIDALAQAANAKMLVDLPTAHGFCVYLRRDCLDETGLLREDAFAQGYGEENDFCLRATALGWRHVGVASLYVGHVGSASFGQARAGLIERNMAVLNQLHPGYDALIAAFSAADPLFTARRSIDVARLRAERDPMRLRAERDPMRARAAREPARAVLLGADRTVLLGADRAVLLVTHDNGGGVERFVRDRAAVLLAEGRRPLILRPREGRCTIAIGSDHRAYPNLAFALPEEASALLAWLGGERPEIIEIHHRLGHDPSLIPLLGRLGAPIEYHVHDYASFCPRIALVGGQRRYCGEPDVAGCIACVADHGSELGETIGVEALRARSAVEFAQATRVVVPSADAAARLARHFPGVAAVVRPLEIDADLPALTRHVPADRLRIAVVGGIGVEKGYDILLACARDAQNRVLPIEFVVVGGTIDDERLMEAGPVFVTGAYEEAEAEALVRAQTAQAALLPSVWPETWCYALGLAWRAGLEAVVFDLGAPAARVRATGRGLVLPYGVSASSLNNSLLSRWPLAAGSRASHPLATRRATMP